VLTWLAKAEYLAPSDLPDKHQLMPSAIFASSQELNPFGLATHHLDRAGSFLGRAAIENIRLQLR
jgi:hypothetical protein